MKHKTRITIDIVLVNLLQKRDNGIKTQDFLINNQNISLPVHDAINYCKALKDNGKKYFEI